MPTNISRITIHATPQTVWDVLTNPQWVKKWEYGSDCFPNFPSQI